MSDIKFEYAIQLEQNEQKWEFRQEKLQDVIMYFSKNTILQFTAFEVSSDAYELYGFLQKGERGEFLASQIDKFMERFEKFKNTFEQSGLSEALAKVAKINSQNLLNNES